MNKLPPFSDFIKQLDFNTFSYDLNSFASKRLKEPSDSFTQEQYDFMTATCSALSLALLQAYHQWIAEQLEL